MKKIGIITKYDNNNYGNRLQNYALQFYLNKKYTEYKVITIKNSGIMNSENNIIKSLFKRIIVLHLNKFKKVTKRKKNFYIFNKKNIDSTFFYYDNFLKPNFNKYFKIILGSDQIWNPNFDCPEMYFGDSKNKSRNISYAASFGITQIPLKFVNNYKEKLNQISNISVREDSGKDIVQKLINRNDVEVLVDPTMLLIKEEWDKVSKKPSMLKSDKFILNYFLGDLSDKRKKEIEKVAKENNCEIINILDEDSLFYECGPSEFLYLEKYAFLICTDSFHSSAFAILYNTPFLVFDREQANIASMNSRIETLLSKFKLEGRKYVGKIEEDDLKVDYTEAYKILETEREKANDFLEKALGIKEDENYE